MPPRQSIASEPPATSAGNTSDNFETKEDYCLCKGADDGRPMVGCNNCNNWFHFACIGLDEATAAELETYACADCAETTGQNSTYSWEVTDDELTFATRGSPEPDRQSPLVEKVAEAAPNQKRHQSNTSKAKSETPKPSIVVPAPTFAPPESDSDFEMKEDDEEYTEERRRARKKGARRVAESDSSHSDLDAGKPRTLSGVKRKANALGGGTPATAKRKRVSHNHSSSQQIASDPMTDPLRKHFHDKLKEIMAKIFVEYRAMEDDDEVSEERAIELSVSYAKALEAAVFEACAEINATRKRAAGQSYRTRCMTLTFNLSQDDRTELHSRIGTLSLPAQELAVMPSSELANDAFKQKMEKIALQQLAQTTLKSVDTSRPRAKITHKGEELIDSYVYGPETSGAIEVEDRMEQRRPLRLETNLSGDGGAGVPSSAIEQTPASATMAVVDTPASAATESVMNETAPASAAVGETSVLSPVVATHTQAEDLSGAGADEAQNQTGPTSAILSARPVFDLNSLWSGAEGGQPPSASVDEDMEPLGSDEDEAAMDLDLGGDEVVGGVGDDDFARFLEGVHGAKPREPSKNAVGIPSGLPPRRPSESDMDSFEKLPVVWSGDLTLPLDPNPAITAAVKVRQVAGRDLGMSASLWKPLLAHSKKECIWIEGRVPTDRSTKYLVTARMNAGKELIAVMLVPDKKDENAKVKFSALVDTLIRKERHGLVFPWGSHPPSSAPGKDMYLIPLKPSSQLPEFIELLDRPSSVPKRRDQDAILGVYVLTKGKLVVPPPTPPVPVATPVPVPAAPPPAVASLIQSQGGISSLLSSVLGSLPPPPTPQPIPAFAPPPQLVQIQPPPTATLAALSSDLQNLTPDQINLILQGLAGKAALPPPIPPTQPQGWPAPYPGGAPQPYPPVIPPVIPPAISPSNAAYPAHGQSPLGRSPLQHTVHPDRATRAHSDQRPYLGSSPRRERDRDRDRDGGPPRGLRRGGHNYGHSRDDSWRRGERERDSGWASRRGSGAAAGR